MSWKCIMESVLEELQCPVCLDLYQAPVILPCSHILCRACGERLFDMSFVQCPICRDGCYVSGGIDNLPKVITLENIIARYQNGGPTLPAPADMCGISDSPCQLCRGTPKKASKMCLDCKALYCRKCLELSHPSKEPFLRHQLIEPRRKIDIEEIKCPVHEQRVNIYCADCRVLGCLLCADERSGHQAHKVLSIQQGYDYMKNILEASVTKLEVSERRVNDAAKEETQYMEEFMTCLKDSTEAINSQCDSIIQEIESKREFFLTDLEYDKRYKGEAYKNQLEELKKRSVTMKSVIGYAKEVLNESDHICFLQIANSVSEKLEKNLVDRAELGNMSIGPQNLRHRVVDLRKERAICRDMGYLTVPVIPVIDESRCARSTTSVVIALCVPDNDQDVINGYKVYYCAEEQKAEEECDMMLFKTPLEERKYTRGAVTGNAVCLIHDDLQASTDYFFQVRAFNSAGESASSPVVRLTTLQENEDSDTLQKPSITESMCRCYTTSIQVYSTSPVESGEDSDISYFLMYREAGGQKIWKSISLYRRLDHRVFGLEPDTLFDFVIMALDPSGKCQVSNQVSYRTERAAY